MQQGKTKGTTPQFAKKSHSSSKQLTWLSSQCQWFLQLTSAWPFALASRATKSIQKSLQPNWVLSYSGPPRCLFAWGTLAENHYTLLLCRVRKSQEDNRWGHCVLGSVGVPFWLSGTLLVVQEWSGSNQLESDRLWGLNCCECES